jgi:hypothetical protein
MCAICVDNECIILLINNNFFSNLKLKYLTKQFSVIVFVRNIKNDKYLINNYLRLLMYL